LGLATAATVFGDSSLKDDQRDEFDALVAVERRGEIEDLREALKGHDFDRLQSWWSKDAIAGIGIGCTGSSALCRNTRWYNDKSSDAVSSAAYHLCGGSGGRIYRLYSTYVLHRRCKGPGEASDLRKERWKKLPEHDQQDMYSAGDHLVWLKAYRKARNEQRKEDWKRTEIEPNGV
jgi:hypothetical protein